MKTKWITVVLGCTLFGFGLGAVASSRAKTAMLTQADDVKWTPLVPDLGAKGPQLSVVFGDTKKGPVGLLLKIPAGFKSGPHTHSSDYWGVVLNGTMHDYAPGTLEAAKHMEKGSWWTEPSELPHENFCSEAGDCEIFAYFPNGFDSKPIGGGMKTKK
jgi:hypothetical protein